MAKFEILADFILSWEGGFANHKNDKGGATNRGVTIATWKKQGYDKDGDGDIDVDDLKLITADDAQRIMRLNFWNRWKADQIKSQAIANSLVDFVWGSGKWGIVIPQKLLGVTADGIVGSNTLAVLNSQDPQEFFNRLQARRKEFLLSISKPGTPNHEWRNGWLRRLASIQYRKLVCNNGKEINF